MFQRYARMAERSGSQIFASPLKPPCSLPHPVRPSDPPGRLNSYMDDPCCARYLAKALRSGLLAVSDSWHCPKCNCLWKPREVAEDGVSLRHWQPHECIMRF